MCDLNSVRTMFRSSTCFFASCFWGNTLSCTASICVCPRVNWLLFLSFFVWRNCWQQFVHYSVNTELIYKLNCWKQQEFCVRRVVIEVNGFFTYFFFKILRLIAHVISFPTQKRPALCFFAFTRLSHTDGTWLLPTWSFDHETMLMSSMKKIFQAVSLSTFFQNFLNSTSEWHWISLQSPESSCSCTSCASPNLSNNST